MTKDWYFETGTPNKEINAALRKLAKSFARTHRDYLKFYEEENGKAGDVGWFYNERPNIGFLAAAAWRIPGWVALEEFTILKGKKKEKESLGRADLYIGVPRGKGRNDYFELGIESKLAFIGSKKRIRTVLNPNNKNSALARAMKDAKTVATDYPVDTVFLCPGLKAGKGMQESLEKVGEEFWRACAELKKHKLNWVAFSFVPKNAPEFRIAKVNRAYPAIGVVMVGV